VEPVVAGRYRLWAWVAAGVLLLALGGAALWSFQRAPPTPQVADAREVSVKNEAAHHRQSGLDAMSAGDFTRARLEFLDAARLDPKGDGAELAKLVDEMLGKTSVKAGSP
jgi:hypothetical protein